MVGAKLVKIDKFCPLTHAALGSSPLQPSFFICIIISFRPAWLARVLLCYKRTQSSGNDDVDEGQQTPLDVARGDVRKSRAMWLTKTVDISVSYPVHVVVYTVPACPADASQTS